MKSNKTMREFKTGAHRDSGGKFDFIEYMSTLAIGRYAEHMRKMAVKYGAGNWLKGIPAEEFEKSLRRHLWQYDVMKQTGVVVEPGVDHLASAMFNLMGLMHEQELTKLKTEDTLCGYPIDRQNIKRVL